MATGYWAHALWTLVRFETEGVYTDEITGKPVATVSRYVYEQNDDRIVVSLPASAISPASAWSTR